MFNQMQVIGNLTKENDLKYLASGSAVYKNSVATSHKWKDQNGQTKDETMFMDIVMFSRSAEIANQYLKKGSKVFLQGRVVLENWTATDGTKRSRHILRVETMKMLDSKNSDSTPPGHQYQTVRESSSPRENQSTYTRKPSMNTTIPEIDIDDELPF